jgi:cysteine desulfurase
LGAASAIASRDFAVDAKSAAQLRERFLDIIRSWLPDVRVNGEHSPRLPGNLSLTFPGIDADHLVGTVQPDIAISTNAACNGGVLRPSHVLLALGLSEADAASTIRIGFGRFNTPTETEAAAERLAAAAIQIRRRESWDNIAA